MASGSFHVPVLKGHVNYACWRLQMKMFLIHQDLFECVTGECEDGRKNQKALATIVLGIDPSLLYLIGTEPDSAQQVWEVLEKQFQKDSWLNKLSLKKKLYGMRLENGDINTHIKEMTETFQSLSLLGCKIDDEEKVCLLLSSLPSKYDVLVTAFGATEKAPAFEQVIERLLSDSTRSSSYQPEEAMKAKGGKRTLKCFNCHKEGHFKSACPLLRHQNQQKKSTSKHSYSHSSKHSHSPSSFVVMEQCLSGDQCQPRDNRKWILDSGATSHMCNDISVFRKFQRTDDIVVTLGDGHSTKAIGVGEILVDLTGESCILTSVLCVPDLKHNLISVSKILLHGGEVTFSENCGRIINSSKRVLAYVEHDDKQNQFFVKCKPIKVKSDNSDSSYSVSSKDGHVCTDDDGQCGSKEDLWHCRFGHLGVDNLCKLSQKEMVQNFDYDHKKKLEFCEFCTKGKHNRSPFPTHTDNQDQNESELLRLIHSDVCGPLPKSIGNNRYFVTFIDDYSRHCWVYPIQTKDQVFGIFKGFKAMIEKISSKSIKILRSDNGGEYKSNEFKEFLTECGIRHEFTIPKTPEQNGVAERLNRVLIERVRTILIQSKLPQSFWAEALNTVVHVHNLSPSRVVRDRTKTPRELFMGKKPNVSYLRPFGCTVFVHIPKDERKKLDPKSIKCIFMGYGKTSKGYRVYDPEKGKIILSRDVIFNEWKFEGLKSKSEPQVQYTLVPGLDLEINSEIEHNAEEVDDHETQNPVRRTDRITRPIERYGEWLYSSSESNCCDSEPINFCEALQRQDREFWKEATDNEYNSLIKNDVWNLTELPKGRKAIGCKWVFKRKMNPDGTIERYKARLVAQGYSQVYGEDYDEVFAPVARFESVRTVISQAVKEKVSIHQMDITAAFLNGDLDEEIYMKQPEGYVDSDKKDLVCCLKKSLYGLKQSPKCWNEKFDACLKKMGFKKTIDPCVYVRENKKGDKFKICLYVDDLILVNKDEEEIAQVKNDIAQNFEVKDLGELNYFLGVEFKRQENGSMWMGQEAYTKQILTRFGMENCSSIDTPVCNSQKLTQGDKDSERVDVQIYKSAVGSLLHLSNRTRPDIAYAVGMVARFSSDPCKQHWVAVKRILRYLKGTTNFGLMYGTDKNEPDDVESCVGFSDADWAGDLSDRKSTSGYIFMNAKGAVQWGSKKQTCVALSTAEAEYIALALTTQEGTWLNTLITQISGNNVQHSNSMIINEDNQSAIFIANGQGSKRSKHIDIKYHYVQDKITNGEIALQYCKTQDMVADIMTKALPRDQFVRLRSMMGMVGSVKVIT